MADENPAHKDKVVLSKATAIFLVILAVIIIVAVGLLAGLLSKSADIDCVETTEEVKTTSNSPLTTKDPSPSTDPWANIRLPSNLIPHHYVVDLQPLLTPDANGLFWFNGSSKVDFYVSQTTNIILIHSNKLNYTSVSISSADDSTVTIVNQWPFDPNQYLVIELNHMMVEAANYTLETVFYGELASDLKGLYLSTYTNTKGEQVPIAVSQMQPTDARKAFPCFDEPAFKATFDIYLWHQDPNFALSNMPVLTTENMFEDWKRTKFERTLPMSTYLLAFVVSEFSRIEAFTAKEPKIQTRIYARSAQVDSGNVAYAGDITPTILDYYAEYFNVSYPLPKSDQIAIPDFALGGMENWGLVMYRETALLYDPVINSASNRQRVTAVVAHELTHQWFGNLITPIWWDELWLNEGFASFIEYLGMDKVEPTYRAMDQIVVIDLHLALNVDALITSRPIVAENVNTPSQINALFDDISYQKAACIIRMISEFTGDEAFTLGLKNYLEKYAYGSVNHTQLFEFWEAAANEVSGVAKPPGGLVSTMNTWVLQMGYPTLTMTRSTSNPNQVVVTQQRFLLDPEADSLQPLSPYSYQWVVPFWYIKEGDASKTLVWMEMESDLTIDVPSDHYIIGNYEVFGYYRVNYDAESWRRIIAKLNSKFAEINVKSRGQIVDDAFNLARAGKLDYETALNLTAFLRHDFDYIPWESALDVLQYFDMMLARSKVYGVYQNYLLYLVQPLYDNVTWNDGGEHLEQYQRVNAINTACSHEHEDCISQAEDRFHQWKDNSSNILISPNLRSTVYCNGIAFGSSEDWDFLWNKYQNEGDSQEKSKLQYALTCARMPWIIERFLQYTIDNDLVRKQDATGILEDLCYNEYARDMTWDFLRKEWNYIYEVYGTGFFSFSGIIESCTSHFSTDFELKELETFKSSNSDKLGSGLTAVNQAIEKTKTNIQWREKNEDIIFNWLTETMNSI